MNFLEEFFKERIKNQDMNRKFLVVGMPAGGMSSVAFRIGEEINRRHYNGKST